MWGGIFSTSYDNISHQMNDVCFEFEVYNTS